MKKNIKSFTKMKKNKEPITWVTSYSYPTAYVAEKAGVDMILVGDSGGMVELGYETTNPVTMDEMITFAKAVRRGAPNTFIVGDMPQGSYEISNEEAIRNAMRFVKEAGCDAIKLEGGKRMCERIKSITQAGILVVGHLGLTPQSTVSFGGYRVQGKTVKSFEEMVEDSIAIENAGIFMLLLEAIPAAVGEQIKNYLNIPIMGIGAGNLVDGQLIIIHDLAGFYSNFRPWFAKCYIPQIIHNYTELIKNQENIKNFGIKTRDDGILNILYLAIKEYVQEVKKNEYPNSDYIYPINSEELELLECSPKWLKI